MIRIERAVRATTDLRQQHPPSQRIHSRTARGPRAANYRCMANAESNASYYALLNVPKEAIRRAFRNLAQTYHPDKHAGSELQSEASASFTLLQEAYEVRSLASHWFREQHYSVSLLL